MYHLKLYVLTCLLCLLILPLTVKSQLFSDYPCYAISHNNGNTNVLFKYQVGTAVWDSVAVTGAYDIKSLALDPLEELIYACNGPLFGTIDPLTGGFTAVGLVGLAQNGVFGLQLFDDVVGLTYDNEHGILYAVERMVTSTRNEHDILFKIDPATGKYIPGSFVDDVGNLIDYVRIPHVNDGTEEEMILDVEDIAMNPLTGELFATHDQGSPGKITIIDTETGELKQVLLAVYPADIAGLTFTNYGFLYGTTAVNTDYGSHEGIVLIDYLNGSHDYYASVDPTNRNFDFQAVDCYGIAPGCYESLNLDNIPISKNLYKAESGISINNRILESNTSLTLRAGSGVSIDNNFEAPSTCNFSIEIGGCQ